MISDYYKTLSVYRLSETKDQYGGVVRTYNFRDDIKGLINRHLNKRTIIADKYQIRDEYNLYCDITGGIEWSEAQIEFINANIPWEGWPDEEKVIIQGDRIVQDGIVYQVMTNPKNTVHRNHHLKFILERIDADV